MAEPYVSYMDGGNFAADILGKLLGPRMDPAVLGADGSAIIADSRVPNGYSFQVIWAGASSPVGTVKIQVSNDPTAAATDLITSAKWKDYPSLSFAIGANDGSEMLEFTGAENFLWTRLVYDATSGTGSGATGLDVHVFRNFNH